MTLVIVIHHFIFKSKRKLFKKDRIKIALAVEYKG